MSMLVTIDPPPCINEKTPHEPLDGIGGVSMEATTGFEPVDGSFADFCLTTWRRRRPMWCIVAHSVSLCQNEC